MACAKDLSIVGPDRTLAARAIRSPHRPFLNAIRMDVDPQTSSDDRECRPLQYSRASQADLELLAVSAIREHRRLFESDQTVYEEWERAFSDPNAAVSVTQSLQDEYMRRRARTAAQQEQLADLIDALGYIPKVLPDGDG